MDDYLEQYLLKRNFRKTPEPAGGVVEEAGNASFVVHRHDARSLHYDLRIAHNGRLICWAVPRGFTYEPSAKRLAVHTEDHPINYISFEGIIPRGEYGAGSMNIWDLGTYRLARGGDLDVAVAGGDLKLRFYGRRLRGEWHLVKLKKERKDEWLVFKARDAYQGAAWDALLSLDLSRQPEADLPGAVMPMKYGSITRPFTDPEWGFELAHEGLRVMCVKQGDEISFIKNGSVVPESDYLVDRLSFLRDTAPERAAIDGIIASVDSRGLSSRQNLERIMEDRTPAANLYFYMVDVLNFDGYDVTGMPYTGRKVLLSLAAGRHPRLPAVDFLKGNGELLAAEAKRAGVEALVAKKLDAPYVEGESDLWKLVDLAGVDAARAGAADAVAPGPAITVTNPEKIFFPGLNLTKKDLVYYYNEAADLIMPWLKDRPVHILRFPDGIHGQSFYQKHLPGEDPALFEFITPPGREGEQAYFICRDRSALLHLVNLGSIDLHVWFSRKQDPDNPDWIAWDLDPKQASFSEVIRIAKETGKILRGIGLTPFIKTSGKSGLHILVPVRPEYTYEQTRMFSESVARIVAREFATIATVERNIEARGGRVYIDFLQNRRGQTLAAPYTVRPVPSAAVSMPLEWEELDGDLSIDRFTLENAMERVSRKGDIFHDILTTRQTLDTAIQKLDGLVKNISSGGNQ